MISDTKILIAFIESICDETMLEEHNLVEPISRLKNALSPVNGDQEIMGPCAHCANPIDRYSPHERCWVGDIQSLEYLCNSCSMGYTDAELAEKDIITEYKRDDA